MYFVPTRLSPLIVFFAHALDQVKCYLTSLWSPPFFTDGHGLTSNKFFPHLFLSPIINSSCIIQPLLSATLCLPLSHPTSMKALHAFSVGRNQHTTQDAFSKNAQPLGTEMSSREWAKREEVSLKNDGGRGKNWWEALCSSYPHLLSHLPFRKR